MTNKLNSILKRPYPRHYVFRKPYMGVAILALSNFGFLSLYKPTMAHEAGGMSYELTMAAYSLLSAAFVLFLVKLIKCFNLLGDDGEWTVLKEIIAIFIILAGMGLAIYLGGFIIEDPAQRWNWHTFFDSFKNSFLIGIIPLLLISLINFRYLLPHGDWIEQNIKNEIPEHDSADHLIHIKSKLKKEALSFLPGQLVYIASDGNYSDFFLEIDGGIKKMTIRNSISNIEDQLSEISFFVRTHRAFIVNLNKVIRKEGNALGYRLTLEGIKFQVPVSRQKIREFDQQLIEFLN